MIILFGAEKGGVGKSTIAVNMAAMRAATRDVLLIDTDRQGSAQQWASIRKSKPIACVAMYGGTLSSQVRAMAPKYDDIIIDAGGRDSAELRAAMLVADVIVTPSMPSQFDIFTLAAMDNLVGQAKAFNENLRAVILVNGAPTNARQTDAADMREALSDMASYKVLQTIVKSRKAYRLCAMTGLAVTEFDQPDEKAVEEMKSLFEEVFGEIH